MIETVDGNELAYEYDFIRLARPDSDVKEDSNGSLGRGTPLSLLLQITPR